MFKEKNREINKVLRISKNHKNFTSIFWKFFIYFWVKIGRNWSNLKIRNQLLPKNQKLGQKKDSDAWTGRRVKNRRDLTCIRDSLLFSFLSSILISFSSSLSLFSLFLSSYSLSIHVFIIWPYLIPPISQNYFLLRIGQYDVAICPGAIRAWLR